VSARNSSPQKSGNLLPDFKSEFIEINVFSIGSALISHIQHSGMLEDIEKLKVSVGERLRVARIASDLSQANLAEKLDRSVETISNIERGVSLAPLDTLQAFCHQLDLNLSDLFDGDTIMQDKKRESIEMNIRLMIRKMSNEQAALSEDLVSAVWRRHSEKG